MSRGPGRIERAIRELLDTSPDRAFMTADLAKHCFAGADWIERKHEVSVLRAVRKIVADDPDWCSWRRQWGSIVYNRANLQSTALAEIVKHEGRLPRPGGTWNQWDYPDGYDWRCWRQEPNVDRAFAVLNHPYCQAHMTQPDGEWCKAVRLHCAQRDGDAAVAAPLRLEAERKDAALTAELFAAVNKRSQYTAGGMLTTLMALGERLVVVAAELRELTKLNDPDAVRDGIAAIADQLENLGGHRE
jgi:hypothetical protein